ncbi:MAG: DNA-directed RNA polymerase subunit beta', partial [Chloroflexi bacterium]|nr:DNA-directed RNA polymerase subunit beta' [Chloroflexota bacterium]
LYRRVINRNNRLRRLLSLGAPEIIIRNEKRMLQEAVDSLIDNGRRGRAMAGSSNRRLKSLSDMLKGKQGRFRQNLLGKRVDYSGRSVIVVGPELKLNQCGLPKRMALELFKPFVMRRLVERGFAHNIKSAKRLVERVKPEVWDVLEEVIVDRPVLLNRAPTLHRLGIQAFEPVLIEGSSIQIHPLVCAAFNADFDGDQMAVHVPLGAAAVEEAKRLLISVNNMLSPSSGEPIVAPTLDIVLGCYYMTILRPGAAGEGFCFGDFGEARFAYELGKVALQAPITVRDKERGVMRRTSVGRILFNDVLPPELRFRDEVMDKKAIKNLVAECLQTLGNDETASILDSVKRIGFHYATQSGLTIAISDLRPPENKEEVLTEADRRVAELDRQYRRGLITDDERYEEQISIWTKITDDLDNAIGKSMGRYGAIDMMATSGAKGNISQIRQMAGMRGLMTDPSGRIIELPIRSSFREGLSVLEYFISTHGARKGLADTALRTADSGYLTRRLVDVAQDVIVKELDCGTMAGIWAPTGGGIPVGRVAAADVAHPQTNELLVSRGQPIGDAENGALAAAGIEQVYVRSPLICETRHGVCQLCYGRSPATGRSVAMGDAVGIVAAQSIGEPGTQLTMRTFHTGGVAGLDITSGLPRVEELFEARLPKGEAIVAELDGQVDLIRAEGTRRLKIVSSEVYRDEYPLPAGYTPLVAAEQRVEAGDPLAAPPASEAEEDRALAMPLVARIGGHVAVDSGRVVVLYEEREEREYPIPATARLKVEDGARVRAGDQLTEGSVNPQAILRIQGREA